MAVPVNLDIPVAFAYFGSASSMRLRLTSRLHRWETGMKKLLVAMIGSVFVLSAFAQAPATDAGSCEAKALDKNGKPLYGAAKASFIKKCEKTEKSASCEASAVSKDGKPLHGAAKDASVKKCLGSK